ncbi:hypothetical protein M407DRAFT_5887 [Tulasnella calospora MUT 4182]|uniref:Phosphatidic acid phosphatase type 2/haloperoxidase domain-containing protein n=1 Tax=Tulasnella calospora MUT 4182 TaxID=1051891 RepID=A0A0C3QFB6_9AGAM|nr:hypothetical protein M407DRAFT_5887 [Tulasnella calospora MUT 4182]
MAFPQNSSPVELRSFDYTHVLYDPASTTSELLALFTLFPILLFASYAALVVVTRELTVGLMLIGQLANEVLNSFIKEYFKHERPLLTHGSGYGFPSSHSQYMGFFSTFLILHFAIRHRFNSNGSTILDGLLRLAIVCALILWAGLVAYSRYHLKYHTSFQIIGGLSIGAISGSAWYLVAEYIPVNRPDSILGRLRTTFLDSRLARWLRIRDGWAIYGDGGHEEEWVRWRERFLESPSQDDDALGADTLYPDWHAKILAKAVRPKTNAVVNKPARTAVLLRNASTSSRIPTASTYVIPPLAVASSTFLPAVFSLHTTGATLKIVCGNASNIEKLARTSWVPDVNPSGV